MTKLYMLDTNIVSFILTKRSCSSVSRLISLSESEITCVSAITAGELFFGLEKSGNNERRRKRIDWFLHLSPIQPWNREAAATYGKVRSQQEASGYPLQPLDTQIAAHALALGATLVTHDRAFRHIPALLTEDWATDC